MDIVSGKSSLPEMFQHFMVARKPTKKLRSYFRATVRHLIPQGGVSPTQLQPVYANRFTSTDAALCWYSSPHTSNGGFAHANFH